MSHCGLVASARLVYPKRNRAVDDGETFVARVTAPALDDDGRPIRSTLDQRFLVE